MAGILCSCRVPWRIAVLDGKSIDLCPCCGAWREAAVQVQPGLWQDPAEGWPTLPKRDETAQPPEPVLMTDVEAGGCVLVMGVLAVLVGWLVWLTLR